MRKRRVIPVGSGVELDMGHGVEQGGQALMREGGALGHVRVGAQLRPFWAAGQAGGGLEFQSGLH